MRGTEVQQVTNESNLYTSGFEEADAASIPEDVGRAVAFLEQRPDVLGVYRVACGEQRGRRQVLVGVRVDLGRHLPPRCEPAAEGMMSVEPVALLFDEERYPIRAPRVGSDRKDFSWQGKLHISQTSERWPPLFCLARVSLDDWFAEHGFAAFFDRLTRWLDDAAQGNLQREDGRFEPTVTFSEWSCLFDYERVVSWIKNRRGLDGRSDFYFGQHKLLKAGQQVREHKFDRFAVKYAGPVSAQTAMRYILEPIGDKEGRAVGGIIAWTPAGTTTREHFTTLPDTRDELYAWGNRLDIPLQEPLEQLIGRYQASSEEDFMLIPMLIGVQRPSLLFGVESDLEVLPLAFWRNRVQGEEGIFPMRHQHPLTKERAQQLSNTKALGVPVTLVGAGALGSKLFAHWYRGGHARWTLVDNDLMAAHNLVRHALLPEALGAPKVEGLQAAMQDMFEDGDNGDIEILDGNLQAALSDGSSRRAIEGSFVVDVTASPAALRQLTANGLPSVEGMARCTIVDEGRKATLLLEGSGRNPRLDDLRAFLYHLGIVCDGVSEWLAHRTQQESEVAGLVGEEVEIGLGCASDTFRLADDEVSLHAAQLSMRLRHWLGAHRGPGVRSDAFGAESAMHEKVAARKGGRIGLSDTRVGWCEWAVSPVETIRSGRWQVRVAARAAEHMRKLMADYRPDETGGILLGHIDFNRCIIYATEALPPPHDSKHSSGQFVRGKQGVQAAHRRAASRTGSTIGYVGEWHTHPSGPRTLSGRDLKAARKARQRFRGSSFPAALFVMTPAGPVAYVEDPLALEDESGEDRRVNHQDK